jgi:hypothetical protein
LAAAHITKATTTFFEVIAYFINFFNWFLFNITWVLSATVITVSALSLQVVVANLI